MKYIKRTLFALAAYFVINEVAGRSYMLGFGNGHTNGHACVQRKLEKDGRAFAKHAHDFLTANEN